jgi:hypothetical protein
MARSSGGRYGSVIFLGLARPCLTADLFCYDDRFPVHPSRAAYCTITSLYVLAVCLIYYCPPPTLI